MHISLFEALRKLSELNRNKIWARIIKNAFAPVFVPKADFVVGNPPWIRWNYLPGEYRSDISDPWSQYGLFAQHGYLARLGTAELDFSMLYLYTSVDRYLKQGGRLAFVITLEVVKSKGAGAGFRRFRIGGAGPQFRVERLDDMVKLKPFEAANKTAVIFCTKGKPTVYPVPYFKWTKVKGKFAPSLSEKSVLEVMALTKREKCIANPVDANSPTSPWLSATASQTKSFQNLRGKSDYVAHSGVAVDPYGVYLVRILRKISSSEVLVENMPELGKTKINKVALPVDFRFIFPAVRGKDIAKWSFQTKCCVVVPNKSPKNEDQIPEKLMRENFPSTWEYLYSFKELLLSRGKLWAFYGKDLPPDELPPSDTEMVDLQQYFRKKRTSSARSKGSRYQRIDVPFYAMRDIGEYSFAPYKVIWQMGASKIKAVVLESIVVEGRALPVLPCTGTVSYVAFSNAQEAHYFCAIINSRIVDEYVSSFSQAGRGMGAPSILSRINIPRYNSGSATHFALSIGSSNCHKAAMMKNQTSLQSEEASVEKSVQALWQLQ